MLGIAPLKDLVRYNLQIVRAYLLKEDFQQLWNYASTAWAAKFLDQWCHQVMRSRIEPMKNVARTLRAHRELILNYFRARKAFSSGVIEGLNNKTKVTMRKSYGFEPSESRNSRSVCAWKTARANARPQFLLTNLKSKRTQYQPSSYRYQRSPRRNCRRAITG